MGFKLTKWDKRFLTFVAEVTSWSKDPTTKCGAVIIRPDKSIVSYGYNGFPFSIMDLPSRLNDRPLKNELVVHSETNALLAARESVVGYTAYTSTIPCCRCAVNLIQAGIKVVVCFAPSEDYATRWGESIKRTLALFEEAEVQIGWENY